MQELGDFATDPMNSWHPAINPEPPQTTRISWEGGHGIREDLVNSEECKNEIVLLNIVPHTQLPNYILTNK